MMTPISVLAAGAHGPFKIRNLSSKGIFEIEADGAALNRISRYGVRNGNFLHVAASVRGTKTEVKLVSIINEIAQQDTAARSFQIPKISHLSFFRTPGGVWEISGATMIYAKLTGLANSRSARPKDGARAKSLYVTHDDFIKMIPALHEAEHQVEASTSRSAKLPGLDLFVNHYGSGVAMGPYAHLFRNDTGCKIGGSPSWQRHEGDSFHRHHYGYLHCEFDNIDVFFDSMEAEVNRLSARENSSEAQSFKSYVNLRLPYFEKALEKFSISLEFAGPYFKAKFPYQLFPKEDLKEAGYIWVPEWKAWCCPMDTAEPTTATEMFFG